VGYSKPEAFRKAGRTKRWYVTSADAGFPGNAKICFVPWGVGIVAKVVGLPGFMATLPNWIVPFNDLSIVGLRRSNSPIETPPVVMITSAFSSAFLSNVSSDPGLHQQ
jgi:hypothetical protein